MARNQGGAQLSFLIVSLIFILVLLFVVFQTMSDHNQTKVALSTEKNEVESKKNKISELTTKVNQLRVLIHGSDEDAVPVSEFETMIEKAGSDIATARGTNNVREYGSMADIYSDSIDTIRFLHNELQSQRSAAEAKDNEYQEVVSSKSNLGSQLNEEIDTLRSSSNDLQVQLEQSRTRAPRG